MKKGIKIQIYPLILMGVLIMLSNSCKKDDNPNNTPPSNTVTDIDGNVYHTVTIGTQVWMVENLKTTKYRNGDPVSNVTNNLTWGALTTGAYCNFNNDTNNSATYGRFYNWYAVIDVRNIAPTGWHVSTDTEWTILTTFLGGENIAGSKLKETGIAHWESPNTGASNETGFTALPGGARSGIGTFNYTGSVGFWWSSSEGDGGGAWSRSMADNSIVLRSSSFMGVGFSLRCVKD